MPPSNAKDNQSGLDTRASDPVLGTDNCTETLSDGAYRSSEFQVERIRFWQTEQLLVNGIQTTHLLK